MNPKSKDGEGRVERVMVGFTRTEFRALNALRVATNREISASQFIRLLVLDIIADDQAAHEEAAE